MFRLWSFPCKWKSNDVDVAITSSFQNMRYICRVLFPRLENSLFVERNWEKKFCWKRHTVHNIVFGGWTGRWCLGALAILMAFSLGIFFREMVLEFLYFGKRNAKSLWIQTKMANDVLLGLLEVLGAWRKWVSWRTRRRRNYLLFGIFIYHEKAEPNSIIITKGLHVYTCKTFPKYSDDPASLFWQTMFPSLAMEPGSSNANKGTENSGGFSENKKKVK